MVVSHFDEITDTGFRSKNRDLKPEFVQNKDTK